MKSVMYKRVVLCAVMGLAGFAHGWTRWTNGGGDGLWNNPANWHNGLPGPANNWVTVHLADLNGDAAPHITTGMNAQAGAHLMVNEYAGTYNEMFMSGGTLSANYYLGGFNATGHGHFELSGGDVQFFQDTYIGEWGMGTLDMSGGSISTGRFYISHLGSSQGIMTISDGLVVCSEFYVGNETSTGTLTMTGGEIYTGPLWVPRLGGGKGTLNLYGGTIYADFLAADQLATSPVSLVDITEGVLIMTGDRRSLIQIGIDTGQIRAYGGTGTVNIIWDADENTTTVTAEQGAVIPSSICAQNPLPADSTIHQPLNVSLTWTAHPSVTEHRVYFSDNAQDVASGSPNAFQGAQTAAVFNPDSLIAGQTYYWRIDEFDGTETCPGPVWSFTVTDGSLLAPVFDCESFKLEFDGNGYVSSLYYKPLARELITTSSGNGGFVVYNINPSERLSRVFRTADGHLFASTSTGSRQLLMTINEEHDNYITFRISQLINMPTESNVKMNFFISPAINATEGWSIPVLYGQGVGVGVIGLDYMTRSQPRFTVDWSYLWQRGVNPADPIGGFALFVCSESETLNTVGLIEENEGLPHPMDDNEWAKINNHTARLTQMWVSYNGTTERNQAINYTEQSGVGMFYLPQWMWEGNSAYTINTTHWPNGVNDLRSFSDLLATKGLKLGIHTGSATPTVADTTYVSPIPDNRLATWGTGTLSQAINSSANTLYFIPSEDTVLPTIDYTNLYGLRPPVYPRHWDYRYFRVGNEIIYANTVDDSSIPWVLSNCQRGAQGTGSASHSQGAPVKGMLSSYGRLAVDPNTGLLDELADRMANILNYCNIARVAYDALETVDHAGRWAMGKFLSKVQDRLDHHVAADSSSGLLQYEWHVLSYQNVGEGMHHYPKPYFQDYLVHNVNVSQRSFCPGALGAYTFRVNNAAERASAPDEWEWWLAKAAAYDSCYFFETSVSNFNTNGQTNEILNLTKKWENIRLENVLPQSVKNQMKPYELGFRLTSSEPDAMAWQMTPMSTSAQFVRPDTTLTVNNPFAAQPLRFEFRVLPTFNYSSTFNTNLLPSSPSDLVIDSGLSITQAGAVWTFAQNNSQTSRTQAAKGERVLSSTSNLSARRGLGLYFTGDGKGGYFYVEYRDETGFARRYLVPNDTTGRRLVEVPSAEVSDYLYLNTLYNQFPATNWWSIKLGFRFDRVKLISFGLVDIPAMTSVSVNVEGIKALYETATSLSNPVITLPSGSAAFTGTISSGNYLVYEGGSTAQVLNGNRAAVATIPAQVTNGVLNPGNNVLQISCGTSKPHLKCLFKAVDSPIAFANPYNVADINKDMKVDVLDLMRFCQRWLDQESNLDYDFNGDGIINLEDFVYIAEKWNP